MNFRYRQYQMLHLFAVALMSNFAGLMEFVGQIPDRSFVARSSAARQSNTVCILLLRMKIHPVEKLFAAGLDLELEIAADTSAQSLLGSVAVRMGHEV